MRPYLAIIKDSFREALASRVLWILLILITLVFLAIAPVGWKRQLTSKIGSDDLRRVEELAKRLNDSASTTEPTPEKRVYAMLDPSLKSEIARLVENGEADGARMRRRGLQQNLGTALDELLERSDLYDAQAWSGIQLGDEAQALADRGAPNLDDDELRRFSRLALESAFPRHVRERPSRSVVFTYFAWDVGVPLPLTDEQVEDALQQTILGFMNFFVGFVGVFSGILVTASIIPNTFDTGSVNLLLSKPISRSLLYLSKFLGGCSFVLINATYLVVGLWLIVGWRLNIWNSRMLLCIPVFLFLFILYYCVSGLAGLVWRNTVVCITVTILFWFICFLVGTAKVVVDNFVHSPNRMVRVQVVGDQVVGTTENGLVQLWNEKKRVWDEVFQTGTLPPFGAAFIKLRTGPAYDAANERLMMVERGWPDSRLHVGQSPDWTASDVAAAPGDMVSLLNEPDGRVIGVSPTGIIRFRDRIIPESDRPTFFGVAIPLPGLEGAFQEVAMEPALTLNRSVQAAVAPDSGNLYIWKDGTLFAYRRDGAVYKEFNKAILTVESQRAMLAAAGRHVVLARADGVVEILDADSLDAQREFQPESNNPPRYIVASPNGRYFAVVFHTRRVWVVDSETSEPVDVRWRGQGDISAAFFASDDELMLVDRGNRVSTYHLPDGRISAQLSPSGTVMQRLSWYLIDPVYTVFPRPGELEQTTMYILTGKETVPLASEVQTLDSIHLTFDPWAPVWPSLGFIVCMLLFSCIYISRQEF